MSLNEAKQEFVDAWGRFGVEWGINRTMAQIHALLLVSPDALDTDSIIESLRISRGNANMNLRALLDWGLIEKEHQPGVRREFFRAEKDLWEIARRTVAERRKRELDPLLRVMRELQKVSPEKGDNPKEVRDFKRLAGEIVDLGEKATRFVELVLTFDKFKFFTRILRLGKS